METVNTSGTKQRIAELEKTIINRSREFSGEIGDFHWFLKTAMTMQIHAYTSNDYPYRKPDLKEFEDIMFNIEVLREMFDCLSEIQYLEEKMEKETDNPKS